MSGHDWKRADYVSAYHAQTIHICTRCGARKVFGARITSEPKYYDARGTKIRSNARCKGGVKDKYDAKVPKK